MTLTVKRLIPIFKGHTKEKIYAAWIRARQESTIKEKTGFNFVKAYLMVRKIKKGLL